MVIFTVDASLGTAAEFCTRLKDAGVLMLAIGAQQIRAVTHLDVDANDTARAGEIIAQVAARKPSGRQKVGQGVTYA